MLPTSSMSASLANPLSTLTFTLPRNVIFKLISAPKLWLVYTNFFAITLLHVLISCSRNYSPISLLHSFHTFSITSNMKTLITNQFIHTIHLFQHFTMMTRPVFRKSFSLCCSYFLCNSKLSPQRRAQNKKKTTKDWKVLDSHHGGPKSYSSSKKPPVSANFFNWDRSSADVHAGTNLSHWDLWNPVSNE